MSRKPMVPEPATESGTSWCWLGSYNAHTWNYEQTECIWCGPGHLATKPGRWVPIGNGFSAWSVEQNELKS